MEGYILKKILPLRNIGMNSRFSGNNRYIEGDISDMRFALFSRLSVWTPRLKRLLESYMGGRCGQTIPSWGSLFFASRGCAEWCKKWSPGTEFSIRIEHSCLILFLAYFRVLAYLSIYFESNIYYHTQWFWCKIFENWRHCDVATTSTSRQSCVTSYTTNTNQIHLKSFFLGWDGMGEIRISITSENLGFPYPVCKKYESTIQISSG